MRTNAIFLFIILISVSFFISCSPTLINNNSTFTDYWEINDSISNDFSITGCSTLSSYNRYTLVLSRKSNLLFIAIPCLVFAGDIWKVIHFWNNDTLSFQRIRVSTMLTEMYVTLCAIDSVFITDSKHIFMKSDQNAINVIIDSIPFLPKSIGYFSVKSRNK
jgi:hypothetical protein